MARTSSARKHGYPPRLGMAARAMQGLLPLPVNQRSGVRMQLPQRPLRPPLGVGGVPAPRRYLGFPLSLPSPRVLHIYYILL